VHVGLQYLARLRMDLDIANRRLETVEEEKRKLIQERDQVAQHIAGDELCCYITAA